MITSINLKRNLNSKSICENYAFNILYVYFYRALIKRVIISFKLLYDDLMSLILKIKSLFIALNKALYVFTLLNDAT